MGNPDYPNSGALFKNDRAGGNPKAPQHKGNGSITCPHCAQKIDVDLAAWTRQGKKGEFLSVKMTPKTSDEPWARPGSFARH